MLPSRKAGNNIALGCSRIQSKVTKASEKHFGKQTLDFDFKARPFARSSEVSKTDILVFLGKQGTTSSTTTAKQLYDY
jgi:hypothetical protein